MKQNAEQWSADINQVKGVFPRENRKTGANRRPYKFVSRSMKTPD